MAEEHWALRLRVDPVLVVMLLAGLGVRVFAWVTEPPPQPDDCATSISGQVSGVGVGSETTPTGSNYVNIGNVLTPAGMVQHMECGTTPGTFRIVVMVGTTVLDSKDNIGSGIAGC